MNLFCTVIVGVLTTFGVTGGISYSALILAHDQFCQIDLASPRGSNPWMKMNVRHLLKLPISNFIS